LEVTVSGGILLEGDVSEDIGTTRCIVTKDGGIAILLKNNTGATSVRGTLVTTDTEEDMACKVNPADVAVPVGVIYNDGVPSGEEVWVVISGIAACLLEDDTLSTSGNWVVLSPTQAGRVNATQTTVPNGGDLQAHEEHFGEVGHALETKVAGTNVLCKLALHFN
jgi:hypothetical protein